MKIYIITYNSIIDGEQNVDVYDKAYITKEAAKKAMNYAYKYWSAEAEKYITTGYMVKRYEYDFFLIYNLFKPEIFTVDCSIDEVELPNEDN